MVVILTALELEYRAVLGHLTDARLHPHASGTLFEVGTLAGREVAVACTGVGNDGAAVLTERAIAEFAPALVLFVGIAGGLKDDVDLGDVVVATKVYAYHGGKEAEDGFNSRPAAWEAPHAVEQLARHVARGQSDLKVHFAPVAAGDVVLDNAASPLAAQLRRHYNDAVAIEMESAGVAKAGHLNALTSAMTIRGISDHADGMKKHADRSGSQERAAANAAAFASLLVARFTTRETNSVHGERMTVQNTASGNAHVVVQAGTIHGDLRFGSEKP